MAQGKDDTTRDRPRFGTARDELAGLEAFEHLRDKVCALWGRPEMEDFVRELMLDSRNGARKGLPGTVLSDLVFLSEANRTLRALELAFRQGVPYERARAAMDREDHLRHAADELDDPLVSRDVVVSEKELRLAREAAKRPRRAVRRASENDRGSGQFFRALGHAMVFILAAALVFRYWPHLVALLPKEAAVESQPSRDGAAARDGRADPATTSTR